MSRFSIGWAAAFVVSTMGHGLTWADPQAKPEPAGSKAGVAAYIGEQAITTNELDEKVLRTNMKLAQDLYNARKGALDQVMMERMLGEEAKSKGVTVDQLIKERTAANTKPVTDEDVDAYYKANSGRMGGKTLEQMSGQIRNYLTTQKENEGREALLTELKEKAKVRVVLDPPRADVKVAANDPVKGPKDAKVTIVEFSEFQ